MKASESKMAQQHTYQPSEYGTQGIGSARMMFGWLVCISLGATAESQGHWVDSMHAGIASLHRRYRWRRARSNNTRLDADAESQRTLLAGMREPTADNEEEVPDIVAYPSSNAARGEPGAHERRRESQGASRGTRGPSAQLTVYMRRRAGGRVWHVHGAAIGMKATSRVIRRGGGRDAAFGGARVKRRRRVGNGGQGARDFKKVQNSTHSGGIRNRSSGTERNIVSPANSSEHFVLRSLIHVFDKIRWTIIVAMGRNNTGRSKKQNNVLVAARKARHGGQKSN
ncbi:hypothetical protein DFH09DRAFT_1076401 [Mycena vulgaris]|nr:hypothetical protein DFH09DRAFT_1076401 [Mycena vulgaris]